tara:strand:+ start:628 stop:882 length:255 start_codon:yes stop_codon:yes gene_type:complete
MDKFNLKEYLKNNRLLNEENSPFVDSKGELIDDILYDYLMDDIDKDTLISDMFYNAERNPSISLVEFMMQYYNEEDYLQENKAK